MTPGGTSAAASARPGSGATALRALSIGDPVFPVLPLTGLLAWARQSGIGARELFHDLDEDAPDCRLSYTHIREGVARAMHRFGGMQLACLTGMHKSLPHIGLLGPAMQAHQNLGAALAFGVGYQMLAGSMLQHSLRIDGDDCVIESPRLFDDSECGPFIDVDHLLANFNLLSALLGARVPLTHVEITATDATLAAALQRCLGTPVGRGAAVTRMCFPARLLATPNPQFDQATQEFWVSLCEREFSAHRGMGSLTLLQRLRPNPGRLRRLDQVADEMHISLRTLHRKLVDEGIDYSELHDCERRGLAEKMLRSGLSCDSIVDTLGLSDSRSFRRAFRRWTGLSPAEFRQRHRSPAN